MNKDATLGEALELYRQKVSILKKGYAQECYRIAFLLRSPLASKICREVVSPDIATYRDTRLAEQNPRTGKQISAATVRLEMSLLSNVFDIGRIEWGICEANPVTNVRKPKAPPGRDRRLLPREERLIMRYCHNHPNQELYSLVVLAIETAMRQGELLKLEWEHINLRNRIAHLPDTKNGTKRDVPLSLKAREALMRLGAKTKGKVFNYTSNGFKSTWRVMMIRLGIEDLHFHDLRHEACSRLFELNTLDVMEIAAISGHKSLSMLKRYTHLKASRLVKKLEGNKHRGQQVVMNHLVPYPAIASKTPQGVVVRVLDFEGIVGLGESRETALRGAQDALLRHLMVALRDKIYIPAPDQFLEPVNEEEIFMIDPLNTFDEPVRLSA
ncbi:tyrosine-type recombinase/integrase [Pseudomonas sp. WS 5532]|uniref:tyrosine-type recombinase/integrase n=1 Tax=Pseudomonas sp. WS 5532 TaxID=2717495 RepID=UPI001473F57E|nr:tyrosine-type recombinase/integrase [Pseudomonas sp. WS 5532]NMX77819.1 tyrosine-type recombinase/integrase [Pseudomonas sp. WS 5532]